LRPLISDATFAANLTNEGGVGSTYRLLRNIAGLWLVQECRRIWALEGRDYSFDQLIALAKEAPALQSFIEPNDPAFADQGDMPARVRAFCAHTGQPEPIDPGAVVRCILESLALKQAQTIEVLASTTGTAPAEIHLVGGGARNELLCRWTAAAAGMPVLAGPEEATLLGNLLVQAMSLGEIATIQEGREVVRASFAPTIYEPQDAAIWQEARERFVQAVALPTLGVRA
jgi:rhamnulokinase